MEKQKGQIDIPFQDEVAFRIVALRRGKGEERGYKIYRN
jgi:hypothetical protein